MNVLNGKQAFYVCNIYSFAPEKIGSHEKHVEIDVEISSSCTSSLSCFLLFSGLLACCLKISFWKEKQCRIPEERKELSSGRNTPAAIRYNANVIALSGLGKERV